MATDTLAAIGGNHLAASLLGATDAEQFGRSHAITTMIETAGDAARGSTQCVTGGVDLGGRWSLG